MYTSANMATSEGRRRDRASSLAARDFLSLTIHDISSSLDLPQARDESMYRGVQEIVRNTSVQIGKEELKQMQVSSPSTAGGRGQQSVMDAET